MSMRAGLIGCTGCDFQGFLQYRPVSVVYCFDDGTEVKTYRELGWCKDCNGIREVEARPPAEAPLQAQLVDLRAVTATRGYRFKRLFSNLTGGSPHEVESNIARIEGGIKLALRQGQRCRCLNCGGLDTHAVVGYAHECGGTLKSMPSDPEAPRFSYRAETIYLDEEGRVLRRE